MEYLNEYKLSELFKFEERDITSYMMHELKLGYKFKDSFNYLLNKMKIQKSNSLDKLEWDEGKNYSWAIMKDGMITLIMRKYRTHFTIYFKNENKEVYFNKYGCLTYNSDREKMKDKDNDKYVDNNFLDLNDSIFDILELITKNHAHLFWNPLCLKRPEHVEVKNVWNGGEDLLSIETFIFVCDELFNKYLELFSQNEMFEKIKTLKVGDILNNCYKITKVNSDLKNDYYHDVGLSFINTNFKESKENWCDVYSLTRFYLNCIFPEL